MFRLLRRNHALLVVGGIVTSIQCLASLNGSHACLLYLDVLGLIALALPRTRFVWCFRTLFPFMPERIEEDDQ